MTLNCMIIDDEPLAVGLLASYARRTPFLNLTGTFNSAIDAIKAIKDNKPDIVFLDIQMPELSGIEFARVIPGDTKIIFTTAFSQYAIEGFKVNAMDYLLKPVSYDDFIKSATKALDWFCAVRKQSALAQDRFIFVRSEYKLIRIRLDDILYIEGLKDYVKIYTESDKPVMSLMNMKKLEEYLPHPEFVRTHRSYIVHTTKIKIIDRFRIVFGNTYIPISESYKENVSRILDAHSIQ